LSGVGGGEGVGADGQLPLVLVEAGPRERVEQVPARQIGGRRGSMRAGGPSSRQRGEGGGGLVVPDAEADQVSEEERVGSGGRRAAGCDQTRRRLREQIADRLARQ